MDRIERDMEGLVRSQAQLLTAQVLLVDSHQRLSDAHAQTELSLKLFIDVKRTTVERLELKLSEVADKLDALINIQMGGSMH